MLELTVNLMINHEEIQVTFLMITFQLSLSLSLSHFLSLSLMSNDSCSDTGEFYPLRERVRERKEENERDQITRPEKGRKIVGKL